MISEYGAINSLLLTAHLQTAAGFAGLISGGKADVHLKDVHLKMWVEVNRMKTW